MSSATRRQSDVKQGVPFIAALASAVAYALAFEPFGLGPVAWVALVPMLVAVHFARLDVAFACGLLFGFVQAAISIHWMVGMFGPLGIFLFAIYGTYYAIAVALIRASTKAWGPGALLWAAPSVWVAVEWIRSETWWLKFSWFTAGSSQHADLWLAQTASWWGVYGLSVLVISANAAVAWVIIDRKKWPVPAVVIVLVAALHGVGASMMDREEGDLPVAMIEGETSHPPDFEAKIDEAMARAPRTQVIVLPEYSTGARVTAESDPFTRYSAAAKRYGVTIVFGGTRDAGPTFENTLFVIGRDGALAGTQVKSVPLPFFRDGLPAKERRPVEGLGCATCYDMDFPFVARDLAANGAELFVFPTMDASDWGRIQHRQHAELAALRAIEHRRWLIRCASSGVSLTVDPWGRVTEGKEIVFASVKRRAGRTFYSRAGFWLPRLCAIAMLVIVAAAVIRERRTVKSAA